MKNRLVVFIAGIPGVRTFKGYWDSADQIFNEANGYINFQPIFNPILSHELQVYEIFDQLNEFITANKGLVMWNLDNPIYVITHSCGANIARLFVHHCDNDIWNKGFSTGMVRSVFIVNGALNSSALTPKINKFLRHEHSDLLKFHKGMKRCARYLCSCIKWIFVKKLNYSKAQLSEICNWENLSYSSDIKRMKIVAKSCVFESNNNIIYQLSSSGYKDLKDVLGKCPGEKTYYFSFYSSVTSQKEKFVSHDMNPIFWTFSADLLSKKDIAIDKFPCAKVLEEMEKQYDIYKDNDGIVSIHDQAIPAGWENYTKPFISKIDDLESGTWYFCCINSLLNEKGCANWDHFSSCWARSLLNSQNDDASFNKQRKVYESISDIIKQI